MIPVKIITLRTAKIMGLILILFFSISVIALKTFSTGISIDFLKLFQSSKPRNSASAFKVAGWGVVLNSAFQIRFLLTG
jgi:hypothetical protein